jgi:hypothetical protein
VDRETFGIQVTPFAFAQVSGSAGGLDPACRGFPEQPLGASATIARMGQGKRAGAKPKRKFRPALLLLALGITVSLVAWGYLVYAAIEFGGEARDGESEAWWWLGVAAGGAAACLFVALMLAARITRALGITDPPPPKEPKAQPPLPEVHSDFQRPNDSAPGGRRAAR